MKYFVQLCHSHSLICHLRMYVLHCDPNETVRTSEELASNWLSENFPQRRLVDTPIYLTRDSSLRFAFGAIFWSQFEASSSLVRKVRTIGWVQCKIWIIRCHLNWAMTQFYKTFITIFTTVHFRLYNSTVKRQIADLKLEISRPQSCRMDHDQSRPCPNETQRSQRLYARTVRTSLT